MLKGKRPSEEDVQSNRIKLPTEAGIRSSSGIKELVAMAETSRGSQVELEWTTNTPGQTFVLDVQWDSGADDPFCSLYEENDSGSKQVWSQSFNANEIDLFYDVLVMSCGAVVPSNKLSDILKAKPQEKQDKDNQSKSTIHQPSPQAKKSESDSKNDFSLNINPESVSETNTESHGTGINQPATTMPAPPFQAPPYNMPPGAGGFPIAYPPGMVPGQAYMTPPVMPPPGWAFTPIAPDNMGNVLPVMPANPYVPQAALSVNRSEPLSTLPIDTNLVNKRYAISLADLLKQADLISKQTLAAALKMQIIVQEGKLPVDKAIKILKQHHQKGESIDNYIGSPNNTSQQQSNNNDSMSSAGKAKPVSKENAAALELLEKAGLLSKDDITTAKNVSRKHGGDLVSILESAQKLDNKTMESALICTVLLSKDLMKLEQCVIALNYCSRSRVGFDEALDELNWENPRKK